MLKNHMSTCKKTHVNMQHLFLMAPQVGGGRWSRADHGGLSWGGEPSRGRVVVRAELCLPAVRSRVCVDAWAGEASGDSFRDVAPVAVWGLRLMLYRDDGHTGMTYSRVGMRHQCLSFVQMDTERG